MDWTEITAKVPTDKTDEAAAIANMTVPYGIYIEDYTNLEADAQEIAFPLTSVTVTIVLLKVAAI